MRLAALLLLAIGVAAGIWDSLSREAGEKSAVAAESRAVVETYLQAGGANAVCGEWRDGRTP